MPSQVAVQGTSMEEVKPVLLKVEENIAKSGGTVRTAGILEKKPWLYVAGRPVGSKKEGATSYRSWALLTCLFLAWWVQQPTCIWVDWPQGMERVIKEVSLGHQGMWQGLEVDGQKRGQGRRAGNVL